MSYTPKDMTGSLFKNEKRESESHPNARGSALIDGVEYWVDAWTNTTQAGDKYQSLKFKRKEVKPAAKTPDRFGAVKARSPRDLEDDDIPFE
jgi:uncharacterized protein (DUF736 family)